VQTLAGRLDSQNSADNPDFITPAPAQWAHGFQDGRADYTFPANSFTVISFE